MMIVIIFIHDEYNSQMIIQIVALVVLTDHVHELAQVSVVVSVSGIKMPVIIYTCTQAHLAQVLL